MERPNCEIPADSYNKRWRPITATASGRTTCGRTTWPRGWSKCWTNLGMARRADVCPPRPGRCASHVAAPKSVPTCTSRRPREIAVAMINLLTNSPHSRRPISSLSLLCRRHFSPYKTYIRRDLGLVVYFNPKVGSTTIKRLLGGRAAKLGARPMLSRVWPINETRRYLTASSTDHLDLLRHPERYQFCDVRPQSLRPARSRRGRTSWPRAATAPTARSVRKATAEVRRFAVAKPVAGRRAGQRHSLRDIRLLCRVASRRPPRPALGRPAGGAPDRSDPLQPHLSDGDGVRLGRDARSSHGWAYPRIGRRSVFSARRMPAASYPSQCTTSGWPSGSIGVTPGTLRNSTTTASRGAGCEPKTRNRR